MEVLVNVWFLLMLPLNTRLFNLHEPLYLHATKGLQIKLQMLCVNPAHVVYYNRSDQGLRPTENPKKNVNDGHVEIQIWENQEILGECWRQGTLLERKHFHLIVCAEKIPEDVVSLNHGDPADIACQKFKSGHGETLQVFRNIQKQYEWSSTMIVDTNVSLAIISDGLKSRVVKSGSSIHFSEVSSLDSGVYSCVVWRENQCQNYKEISLNVPKQDIFLEPNQSFTLPCLVKDLNQRIIWLSPLGLRVPGSRGKYDQSEMLNDTQTGNYSLVIPQVTLNHTGTYICQTVGKHYNNVNLFVCSDLEPINVTFSMGNMAYLKCQPNLPGTLRVQWYRQNTQTSKYLLTDSQDGFVNEILKDRLITVNAQNDIIITGLLNSDGGLYWCRLWALNNSSSRVCFRRKVHLTYVGHDESTFYMVYASVASSVLFALIITVVCVIVLSKNSRPPGDTR